MGIIGILWFIGIFLKIFAVTAISWAWVILWPIPVLLLLLAVGLIFGISFAAFGIRR